MVVMLVNEMTADKWRLCVEHVIKEEYMLCKLGNITMLRIILPAIPLTVVIQILRHSHARNQMSRLLRRLARPESMLLN